MSRQKYLPRAADALVEDIDTTRTPPPVLTAVVTADGPTMRLPDGVLTFPLRALGP